MVNKKQDGLARRGFLGAAMLGIGGAAGWAVGHLRKDDSDPPKQSPKRAPTRPGKAYDIDKYRFVDPAMITYDPAGEFSTGLDKVKGLGLGNAGELLVAGDKEIRSFDAVGQQVGSMGLEQHPHCVHTSEAGERVVGFARHIQVYAADGSLSARSEDFSKRSFVTSITSIGERLYVADAGNREVLIVDRKGSVLKRFGQVPEDQLASPDDSEGEQGFAVPSPYFALASNPQGELFVTNPGHLRVESYSADGEFLSAWGTNGMQLADFTGCCNPVHLALLPDGGFVTSEKGLFRIKTYDPRGELRGVVAGAKFLVPDERVAKAARARGKGTGFDVVVSEAGLVHVLDPFQKSVRTFQPKA